MADQVKRTAGQTDISKLTVDLIKEELRLRRARGEDIPRLPTSRGEALEMIADARRTVPNIPAPPVDDPAPLPVVVVEATGRPRADTALVGRRVLSVESDEDGGVLTQPATIVELRPRATKYPYLAHLEDGTEFFFGLPDYEGVHLLAESVTHCRCRRCMLASAEGRPLTAP